MVEFSTLLSTLRTADFLNEIPFIGRQVENLTSEFRITRIFAYFFIIFFFFYLFSYAVPSAISVRRLIAGRLAIATMQPPTSTKDHRLHLGPFAYVLILSCFRELIN